MFTNLSSVPLDLEVRPSFVFFECLRLTPSYVPSAQYLDLPAELHVPNLRVLRVTLVSGLWVSDDDTPTSLVTYSVKLACVRLPQYIRSRNLEFIELDARGPGSSLPSRTLRGSSLGLDGHVELRVEIVFHETSPMISNLLQIAEDSIQGVDHRSSSTWYWNAEPQ